MALISTVIMAIDASSLTMVYDDTNVSADPAIDIDTAELIRFILVADVPLRGEIYRGGNPNPWRTWDVQPGTYEQKAGGPVKVVGDIPRLWMGTV